MASRFISDEDRRFLQQVVTSGAAAAGVPERLFVQTALDVDPRAVSAAIAGWHVRRSNAREIMRAAHRFGMTITDAAPVLRRGTLRLKECERVALAAAVERGAALKMVSEREFCDSSIGIANSSVSGAICGWAIMTCNAKDLAMFARGDAQMQR